MSHDHDIGGHEYMYTQLHDNGFGEWYLDTSKKLSRMKSLQGLMRILDDREYLEISKWMLFKGLGNPKYKEMAEKIVKSYDSANVPSRFKLSRSQWIVLMSFIRNDMDSLPIITEDFR